MAQPAGLATADCGREQTEVAAAAAQAAAKPEPVAPSSSPSLSLTSVGKALIAGGVAGGV